RAFLSSVVDLSSSWVSSSGLVPSAPSDCSPVISGSAVGGCSLFCWSSLTVVSVGSVSCFKSLLVVNFRSLEFVIFNDAQVWHIVGCESGGFNFRTEECCPSHIGC